MGLEATSRVLSKDVCVVARVHTVCSYAPAGGNSGIGYEVARNLLERNARVIIASRDLEKCLK